MTKTIKSSMTHYGNAGHLCVSHCCEFHLTTKVGKYLVSTVGEYRSPFDEDKFTEIGCGRLYETMVFKAGKLCECGCGLPTTNGEELDMRGYNTAQAANHGHAKMCHKWMGKC
jgi:hypothetical protein